MPPSLCSAPTRRGAREDSDIDVLVVEPVVKSRHAEMVRLEDEMEGLRVVTDILVVSSGVFHQWSGLPGTVTCEAAREGGIVYEPA